MPQLSNGHHHRHTSNQQALLIGFLLIGGFMIVELIGGLFSHSLALLSDAGHMLSDSISLGLSLIATIVGAHVTANGQKTFGYRRFEILAALFNGVLLLSVSALIVIEAVSRLIKPIHVASTEMMIIAVIGLLVNVVVAWVLSRGESKENLNVKSAFLHVIGDMLGSLGAIAAAVLIGWFGWLIADPIASILVSLIILKSGWQVTRAAVNILMESKPDQLDLDEVRSKICAVDGVTGIHDLHVWTITSGFFSLSCHLTVATGVDRDAILHRVEELLEPYRLEHSTIQIEGSAFSGCRSDCDHEKQRAQ
ncbi:MAG: cation diffusion facilitator family transporter [Sporolactobacillus sp.]|jgi:cobalt-zinc-cadmium efflux system protein|nr:cation diffusion facilitator family transporter [Sporolactobacillus sp.]